jgi:hypothetical protein
MRGESAAIGSAQDDAGSGGAVEAKKCGAEIGDPNLRFQPRLPGSVVGDASMRQLKKADKLRGSPYFGNLRRQCGADTLVRRL